MGSSLRLGPLARVLPLYIGARSSLPMQKTHHGAFFKKRTDSAQPGSLMGSGEGKTRNGGPGEGFPVIQPGAWVVQPFVWASLRNRSLRAFSFLSPEWVLPLYIGGSPASPVERMALKLRTIRDRPPLLYMRKRTAVRFLKSAPALAQSGSLMGPRPEDADQGMQKGLG